jgi:hypothetical protein
MVRRRGLYGHLGRLLQAWADKQPGCAARRQATAPTACPARARLPAHASARSLRRRLSRAAARRALWGLHRCLAVLEFASFACPANERHLIGLCVPGLRGAEGAPGACPDACGAGGSQPCAAGAAGRDAGDAARRRRRGAPQVRKIFASMHLCPQQVTHAHLALPLFRSAGSAVRPCCWHAL